MEEAKLRVTMLGNFTLRMGETVAEDAAGRSKKVWLLLAYLLYHRRRTVPQSELLDVFWGEEKDGGNPAGALKTTLHRARAVLDGLTPGLGRTAIVSRSGGYGWSGDAPVWCDWEEFEALCRTEGDGEARLNALLSAVELYQGDFLEKQSAEAWVMPAAAYYRELYLKAVHHALALLDEAGRRDEAAGLCSKALRVEPYDEGLYKTLMRELLALGQHQRAAAVYDEMSALLLSAFGVMPDPESRALYREALRTANPHAVSAGAVRDQLRESGPVQGALLCDYDFFKILYQAEARMVARSGDAVHIALLTVTGEDGAELARRSLDVAMDHLEEQLKLSLRKGDAVSRCSPTQFILMLPQANYENSVMVCQRVIRSFARQYPHSPARISCSVQPLEPVGGRPEGPSSDPKWSGL